MPDSSYGGKNQWRCNPPLSGRSAPQPAQIRICLPWVLSARLLTLYSCISPKLSGTGREAVRIASSSLDQGRKYVFWTSKLLGLWSVITQYCAHRFLRLLVFSGLLQRSVALSSALDEMVCQNWIKKVDLCCLSATLHVGCTLAAHTCRRMEHPQTKKAKSPFPRYQRPWSRLIA